MEVFNIIVNIITIGCGIYLVGLLLFILVRKLITVVRNKKEIKKYEQQEENIDDKDKRN